MGASIVPGQVTPLTSVAQLKRVLRVTPPNVAGGGTSTPNVDDGIFQDLVNAVSDKIGVDLGRNITIDSYTELYNGTGTNALTLANYPVVDVTSISLLFPRSVVGALQQQSVLVAGVDYTWSTSGLVQLYAGLRFPKGASNVQAVYTAGFADVPSDLAYAAAKWCAVRYRELERLGQKSRDTQGTRVEFDLADCPPDVCAVINNYKARSWVRSFRLATPI